MASDSITASPIPSAANVKNLAKKKRTNRTAKLKQNKIDARREQWLSQGAVKNKGCKDGMDDEGHVSPLPAGKREKPSLGQLETRRRGEEENGSIHHDSDSESPSNSPTGNDSGTNFTGSSSSSGGSSSSSSSSSSAGCCSGNITEEEDEVEGDDECLDDWEAMADALAADDKQQSPSSDSSPSHDEPVVQMGSHCEVNNNHSGSILGAPNSKPESVRSVPWASGNSRA